jgi:hypothetical protein
MVSDDYLNIFENLRKIENSAVWISRSLGKAVS